MTYDEHIEKLLRVHEIHEYRVESIDLARATVNGIWRTIHIPKVTDSLTYIVALHEIGHILTHRENAGKLVRESRAWEWAIDNIECDVDPEVWKEAYRSLFNYISQVFHAIRKGWQDLYRGCNMPPQESIVWMIAATLRGLATGHTIHPKEARNVYKIELGF